MKFARWNKNDLCILGLIGRSRPAGRQESPKEPFLWRTQTGLEWVLDLRHKGRRRSFRLKAKIR